jgi:hypothetical protein
MVIGKHLCRDPLKPLGPGLVNQKPQQTGSDPQALKPLINEKGNLSQKGPLIPDQPGLGNDLLVTLFLDQPHNGDLLA